MARERPRSVKAESQVRKATGLFSSIFIGDSRSPGCKGDKNCFGRWLLMDGVTDSTNATIDALWGWLTDQSEGLSEWIEETVEFD